MKLGTYTGVFLEKESFPIRTVSKLTGVNSVTLRAWERRYGLITPQRTESGHRLYTNADIKTIKQAKLLLEAGSSISQISKQLKSSRDFENLLVGQPVTIWREYIDRMIEAIKDFDEDRLDRVYQEALSFHSVSTVTNQLVIPLLTVLGNRWVTQQSSVAEEHFFSVYLRNKIGAQYHHKRGRNNGPLLLTACFPGQKHEFGLLLFGLIAHENNYRCIILGADMPLEELAELITKKHVDALVLSCGESADFGQHNITLLQELATLPIFIGGTLTEKQESILTTQFSSKHITRLDQDYRKSIKTINEKLLRPIN